MTAATAFALRPLERGSSNNGLEGAFRVHLSAKELKNLGLVNGDLIRMNTAKGFHGFAVAWLATQTNPGNKPIAKTTDLLREKYGLALTDAVFIENANECYKAIRTVKVNFTKPSDVPSNFSTEELAYRVKSALEDLDLIFPGYTFEVQLKGPRPRQRMPKFRLTIDEVEPHPEDAHAFYFDIVSSQVAVLNTARDVDLQAQSNLALQIKSHGIGGMSDHINTINGCLTFMSEVIPHRSNMRLIGPTTFLVHGPEGCGKTLLLERLSDCPWRRVFRLDPDWLTSNRKAQAEAMSDEIFCKAREHQPSLILIDRLDKFLQKAETLVSRLELELKRLQGTQVVVAATARSVYDIDASLRTPWTLKTELEIFPPNVRQREDMLRQIIGPDQQNSTVRFSSLAERSHGFVGRDIDKLCWLAADHHAKQVFESLAAEQKSSLDDVLPSLNLVTQEDFDAVLHQVQPTVLKDSILEVPKIRWTDIAGVDHVRKLLETITVRPYKYPDLDLKFGGRQSRKSVLLYGPPGCAKTLIAQAVATESNQNFLAVKGSELIKMYVGESERAIRDVFRRARAAKPCIIFFDEIDSIGKSRERSQDSGLNVVTTLLNEMDGIEALKEVFIIGATNRPDILDSALTRAGRFDAHIHIGLPNEEARRQICEIHTRNAPLAADVDLSILASRTEGSSGADIKGLCAVAIEKAKEDYQLSPESQPEIRWCHFEQALAEHVPNTSPEEARRYEGWRPGKSLSAAD